MLPAAIHTIVLLSLGYPVPAPLSKEEIPGEAGVSLFHRLCLLVSPCVFGGEVLPLYRGFLSGELKKVCYLSRGSMASLSRAVGACMGILAVNEGVLEYLDAVLAGGIVLDERGMRHLRERVRRVESEGFWPE